MLLFLLLDMCHRYVFPEPIQQNPTYDRLRRFPQRSRPNETPKTCQENGPAVAMAVVNNSSATVSSQALNKKGRPARTAATVANAVMQSGDLPVISSGQSLAGTLGNRSTRSKGPASTPPVAAPTPASKSTRASNVGMDLPVQYNTQIVTVPPEPKPVANAVTIVIPIPVPIYIPTPMYMFSLPNPVSLPFPLPIPVPIFAPTTLNSTNGIMKEIKKIQDKMPTDPYEAELLMMAEMVAGEKKKDESGSDSDDNGGNDKPLN